MEPDPRGRTTAEEIGPEGRRVLVVEDKVDAAEALRFALLLRGHRVVIAHDGRSALELARKLRPEFVLCDLGLPDMDGYAVARALRSEADTSTATLIALSGYVRPEDVARARDAGFDRHMAKPPRLDDLFRLLAQVT